MNFDKVFTTKRELRKDQFLRELMVKLASKFDTVKIVTTIKPKKVLHHTPLTNMKW